MEFRLSLSLFLIVLFAVPSLGAFENLLRKPSNDEDGTTWAILVAGSRTWDNYRHQADVCHAYQLLKRGGLKDENIVVFMYDDIAYNEKNPRRGVIINNPSGVDVYAGVPKDYTGEHVNVNNFFAVLLGNKKALNGGSGKVVDSKPNDRIFLFYSDHGSTGSVEMPSDELLYADSLVKNLRAKHDARGYKEMVIYIEACQSGSLFQGAAIEDLNIYVTTSSDANYLSSGTYCSNTFPCLGGLYSVSWMEDSEKHNRKKETLERQYERVKYRVGKPGEEYSPVMEYGNTTMRKESLDHFQGFDPESGDFPPVNNTHKEYFTVNQRDADLLFKWLRYKETEDGSEKKKIYLKGLKRTMEHRYHVDISINTIGVFLFGPLNSPSILSSSRPPHLPVVDDWDCLRSMVRVFEEHCGSLGHYGLKYMQGLANICNKGVSTN